MQVKNVMFSVLGVGYVIFNLHLGVGHSVLCQIDGVGHGFSNHHIEKCSSSPPVLFDQSLFNQMNEITMQAIIRHSIPPPPPRMLTCNESC